MHEFRVTKYNPKHRNKNGNYEKEEWTDFSDVGKSVTKKDYELIEKTYIRAAHEFMEFAHVSDLKVTDLESYNGLAKFKDGQIIPLESIETIIRPILRHQIWCRLTNENGFVHFGYDYYMYIGVIAFNKGTISKIEALGLFVEKFKSPYKH